MTSTEAIAQIEAVDRLYDATLATLQMRMRLNLSAMGHGCDRSAWHNAFLRCPDLKTKADDLMRQRGSLQVGRDRAINREWLAEQRREQLRDAAQRRRDAADRGRRYRTTALAA